MTIQHQIMLDLKQAMKNKDKELLSILRVIIGEFNRIDKEIDDTTAISKLKIMHQNSIDMDNGYEANVLNSYIPTQYTESEILFIVQSIIANDPTWTIKQMGMVMREINQRSDSNLIDNKIASTFVKQLLPKTN